MGRFRRSAASTATRERGPDGLFLGPVPSVALLVGGLVLLVLSALPVDKHAVGGLEVRVFRDVNDGIRFPWFVVWTVMQLGSVIVRGTPSLGSGYLSGHTALAVAMAVVLTPYLGRGGRWAVWILAVIVGLARMYAGAHLPLDVVGGAALGLAVSGALSLQDPQR